MTHDQKITPELFGRICTSVAVSLERGLTRDQAVQLSVWEFHVDPVDVAEISEAAAVQWEQIKRRNQG